MTLLKEDGGRRIDKLAAICVDDDPYVLQMLEIQLKDLFKSSNLLVELIVNPTETIKQIEHLQKEGYDIAFMITDYRMPQMSGYELIYAVKTKYPFIKCILLSGQADKFEVRDLIAASAISTFISKPWKMQDLQNAIGRIFST